MKKTIINKSINMGSKKNAFTIKWLLLAVLFLTVCANGIAQSVSMSVTNCAITAPNEFQFDVMVTNISTTSIQYNATVIRFTHSAAILPSGTNTETWGYVGSSDFPLSYPTTGGPTFIYNSGTKQFSLSTGTSAYANGATCAAPNIAAGETKKLGRYYVRNSQNFVAGQSVGMTWVTSAAIVGYVNCSQTTSAFSNSGTRTLITNPECASSGLVSAITNVNCFGGIT